MTDFRTSPETETIEAIAEKMQQHWQGGGHAYTRPWNNGTEKDCVHGLPGQAEFFRKLARIATSGLAPRPDLPEGATHMRRPEYLSAWLFDGSVMPIWLIKQFRSKPLPESRRGHYATAIDGEFWRWVEPETFHELYVAVAGPVSSPLQTNREGFSK